MEKPSESTQSTSDSALRARPTEGARGQGAHPRASRSPCVLKCKSLRYITLRYVTSNESGFSRRYVTLHYVTFTKSWIRHCTLHYVTLRYVTFTKSWIRHCTLRYITLRYVYKILD